MFRRGNYYDEKIKQTSTEINKFMFQKKRGEDLKDIIIILFLCEGDLVFNIFYNYYHIIFLNECKSPRYIHNYTRNTSHYE